jgi:hypothetical protein
MPQKKPATTNSLHLRWGKLEILISGSVALLSAGSAVALAAVMRYAGLL